MTPDTAGTSSQDELRLELQDGIASLIFDRPDSRVNLLTRDAMTRLDELLGRAEEATVAHAGVLVIRSAKPGNFIAGADIDELAQIDGVEEAMELSRRGQEIFERLASIEIPTLAAIHGACVGGGLELALTCDYRVATRHPKTRLGLPETRLGILPGLGGTVRLPRLIGLRRALDLILSGKQIDADRARSIGLVDRVYEPEDFEDQIAVLARTLADGQAPFARSGRSLWQRWVEDGPLGRRIIAAMARKRVMSETKGRYPAPLRALQVTVDGLGTSRARAQEREARAFAELATSPVCKNLIHVFRIREGARKRRPEGTARAVEQAAVIGAGVMGAGIAELLAYNEIPVHVLDIDRERVQAGLNDAEKLLQKAANRRNWSDEELERRSECLRGTTDYADLVDVDLVVEAVVERMEVKREVFRRLEERLAPDAVIATNTSALSVSELQRDLRHPARVCGLHFFNPPHRMPLVEVVRAADTSDEALVTAFDTATRLGKTPVVVQDRPGFVVNRILAAYLTEAGHVLQEGMQLEEIDRIMLDFGMPMGPFRLLDEVGLDIVAEVSETLIAGLGPRFEPAPVVAAVVETGRTGRKGGRGFYLYEDDEKAGVDPEVARIVDRHSGDAPVEAETARDRMTFVMVNEAARILGEGVVDRPADVDIAMIMGTGFPPFRGGLLRYADARGLEAIVQSLRDYADRFGTRFEPVRELVDRRSFYAS